MRFEKLSKYLEKLESTPSRIEMTKILAELYKEVDDDQAKVVTYLLSGSLGPAYSAPVMGIADKQMVKALKMLTSPAAEKAEELFKQLGDLGKVAEEIRDQTKGKNIDCAEVFTKLVEIAEANGEGSQEKKLQLIKLLLDDLDAISAKYAVRMMLGKLRTGFSDMTVLDALSWMITGDKNLRGGIEKMYNVRADLGEIAEIMKKHKRVQKVKPQIGTPILMAKAERASTPEEIWERNGECAVEYKLDGLRIQAHVQKGKSRNGEIELFSRGMEEMSEQFPDIVEGLRAQINKDCIVEGEVIGVNAKGMFLPFQETMQRKRKYDIAEMAGKIPLKMYLFDVLVVEGENVMEEPNQKRRELLEKLLKDGKTIELIKREAVSSAEQIAGFFDESITDGTEGIIAKRFDGPYQAGSRDFNWIKYKHSYDKAALADTIDAVVMGYDYGQGKRAGFGIGDFLIGVYDPESEKYFTVAKIGTGLTDEEWRKMKHLVDGIKLESKPENYELNKIMNVDVWAKPKIVVEIQADELTKSPMHTSGYALRFPRLISWREKKPEDATSKKEIVKMAEKK